MDLSNMIEKASLILMIEGLEERNVLHALFQKEYLIIETTDMDYALGIVDSKVAAVLSDFPVKNIAQFIISMRNKRMMDIPVIAIVSRDDDEGYVNALESRVADVISKPIRPQIARMRMKAALMHSARQIDPLTGLFTSELFYRTAEELILEHPANTYLIACFDIDNFKAVNAQYGQKTGDFVLKKISNVITDFTNMYHGIACHISADNFAMLLPSDTPHTLQKHMGTLEDEFKTLGIHLKLQISIGRYIISDKQISFSDMMNKALLARRTIKGRYNVSVAYYDDEMKKKMDQEQQIISRMDYALSNHQFVAWLQPKYNHETGMMIGAEALTRWNCQEQKTMIPPDVFIPVFERNGFIYELDKYIWNEVCSMLRQWLDEGKHVLPISVNVSRMDILQEDFYAVLTNLVETYNIPIDLLQLEITESAFSFDVVRITEIVEKLRLYGFTIEIDDFGSAYSSLNILKDVRADVLKLDMRFLSNEDSTGRGGNIIESVVRMSKWIGMEVIAEGVETKEQADFLSSIGCPFIQGYLYAKPMPVNEYSLLLEQDEKVKSKNEFEMINALDGNMFWNADSIESLIFNSYVGGACVVEYTKERCEIIRANDKFQKELCTELSIHELLKIDLFTLMSKGDVHRFCEEARTCELEGSEMRGELSIYITDIQLHKECLRYSGRVIAKSSTCSVIYLLMENITEQKQVQQKAAEMTQQLQFLNEISKSVLGESNTREAMLSLLQQQLTYFNADQALVMEVDEKQEIGRITYKVCANKAEQSILYEKHIPANGMSTWIERLKNDGHIVIDNVHQLKDEYSIEREQLLHRGITSLIAVALIKNGTLIGVLCVEQVRRALNHIGHLSVLGDYVSVLINRRDLLTKIEYDNFNMQRLMNDTPGGFVRMKMLPNGSAYPVFINDGFCSMMGMSHDEVLNLYAKDAYAGVHPDDHDEIRKTLIKAMNADTIFSARVRFYHKEKGYMQFQAYYRTTTDSNGEQYINGYYADITKEDEQEERRRELLDNLPCGAAVYEMKNGDLSVRHVNKQFLRLVSRNEDQIYVDDALTAIHPDDCEQVMKFLIQVKDGEELEHDFRILNGDGNYISMHVIGRAEVQENNSLLIYVTFTPISDEQLSISRALAEQRKAESLAQEVNEQLQFLNEISRYLLIEKDLDNAIYKALQKILEHFDGDRSYIFELDEKNQISINTYEYCAEGVHSEKQNLQNLPYTSQRYVLSEFHKGKNICIENVEDMPVYCKDEQEVLARQGIHNVFLVPIKNENTLIGYAGVDDPRRNILHTEQLVAIGDYMASMLIRRDHVKKMKNDNELMQRLMNDTPGGFVRMKLLPGDRPVPVFINDGFCQMMGMNHTEIMNLYADNAYAGVHPDDLLELQQKVEKAIAKDSIFSARIRLYHMQRGYVFFQAFYRTTTLLDGVKFINGYYADITMQMELEERRKELLDNLPCGAIIFEVTAEGIINSLHINRRFSELVNREGDELQIHDSIQSIHPDDRERMMQSIHESIQKNSEMECDIRVKNGNGGYISFHLVGRIVSRKDQNTVIYTTYTPINEETRLLSVALADQRKAEKIAQESNEQLRFLNDAASDLLVSGDPDEAINKTLQKMLEYFDGDRAYIFELDDEKQLSKNTYELCASGIDSQINDLQCVPYALQEYSLNMLKKKENVCIENIEEIVSCKGIEKQILMHHGIQSLLLVPLCIGDSLSGFLGIDNPARNTSHVDHLAALGDYMAAIILRRNNEARILIDNTMMHDLMNDMPGGFVQMKINADGKVVPEFINQEFCRMSGMDYEECMQFYGDDAYAGVHPDDREQLGIELREMIAKRDTRTLRVRLKKSDGSYVLMQVFYRVTDDGADMLYLNGYYTDLTEQLALEERELAEHDELTNLNNRTKLTRMKNTVYQKLSSCGILFFDVNQLKLVNDVHGHDEGDKLLKLVADSIYSITTDRIHAYRYGGDEFLVVICNGNESELSTLAASCKKQMAILAQDMGVMVSAAVGSAWSKAPLTLNALIRQADQAMYIDKKQHV